MVPDPHRNEPDPTRDEHTRDAPDAGIVRPDQQEELGPLEGLVHAGAVQAAEVLGSEEAEAEAERLGIEAEGFESAQIFSIMLATAVTLGLAVVGVVGLVWFVADGETRDRDAVVLYPELQNTRTLAAAKLGEYGRQEEVYQMPIESAMESVADEYFAEQQNEARRPPENFSTLYLDANAEDWLSGTARINEVIDNNGAVPVRETDAEETVPGDGLETDEPEDN